jgi:transcriptional regulator with XRE-family HTH domain
MCYLTLVMQKNALAKYIEDKGISQGDFAKLLDVSPALVSLWANGQRGPDVTSAVAIEQATGGAVPVETWVGRPDRRRHEPPKRVPAPRRRNTNPKAS